MRTDAYETSILLFFFSFVRKYLSKSANHPQIILLRFDKSERTGKFAKTTRAKLVKNCYNTYIEDTYKFSQ